MPRTPINYSNTIIYKLRHKEDNENANIYVGHTTDFTKRKYNHKSCCSNPKKEDYNTKKYVHIRENGGWDMWEMIEIEKHPCKDKNEAEARERYWYDYFKSKLNSHCPQRNAQEYHQDNKEKFNNKCNEWYENNKEKHAEYGKKYREENYEKCVDLEKKWRENNKEHRQKQQKEYRDGLSKFVCECGMSVSRRHITDHLKTKKHQQILNDKK
jgi:hypothetical protein